MATSFKEFSYLFSAGEKILINAVGSVIRCTQGTDTFDIKPMADFSSFQKIPFENGLSVTYEYEFTGVEVTNTSANSQTIRLYLGDGVIDDARLTGQIDITGGINTKQDSGSTLAMTQANVTGSAASLISTGTGTRAVAVAPQDGDIYIGDSNSVTTANGFKVAMGGAITLTSNDEVFAIAGGTVDCRLMTETFS
tara:strand:- start:203 stop:787 length:585 start_codon:yes stop_codon:yes gene_type:complete